MTVRTALLTLLALAAAGCVAGRPGGGAVAPGDVAAPWPEAGAPDALHALADDLQAYRTAIGRWPDSLADLDAAALATGGPYAANGYAYHPTGLGVLRGGWRVMLVDDRLREAGGAWCLVRPPVHVTGSARLRPALVPLAALREAAAAAGGG